MRDQLSSSLAQLAAAMAETGRDRRVRASAKPPFALSSNRRLIGAQPIEPKCKDVRPVWLSTHQLREFVADCLTAVALQTDPDSHS
jgi:hypothetical protein